MKFLREKLEQQRPLFEKGGKFEKFYYLFEANETFLFSPASTTGARGVQVRDAVLEQWTPAFYCNRCYCNIYG